MIVIKLTKTITEDPKIIRISFKSVNQDKEIILGSIIKVNHKELIPQSVVSQTLSKIYKELFNEDID